MTTDDGLKAASSMQKRWWPSHQDHSYESVAVAGGCIQANGFGGDCWAVHELDGDRVLVMIGDVTGHGIDSALITGVVKGALTVQVANAAVLEPTCASVLATLNQAVRTAAPPGTTMSCAVAIIDQWDGQVTVANAGHPFPYLRRAGAAELSHIMSHGPRLGETPSATYVTESVHVDEGDTMVWHTDGLVENEDHRGRQFGHRRLRELLTTAETKRPADVREGLFKRLLAFCGNADTNDDVAIVVARFGQRRSADARSPDRLRDIWGS